MYHCLFEQSGRFKNTLKKFGYNALDYDIDNLFNETDIQIDLFNEIDKAYNEKESIFDNIKAGDMIIAFYPCYKFSSYNTMNLKCNNYGMKNWSDEKKIKYVIDYHEELSKLYRYFAELMCVCVCRNIKCIIENPYSKAHYLVRYFPIDASVIDLDRSEHGDYYKKPTQYWFINCQPKNNIIESKRNETLLHVEDEHGINRSLISNDYIEWFIKTYIL